jgi:hypothetical protein
MAHISLDTFPQFITSPLFCYIIHKIAIRFRHWSSQATPGTPASYLYFELSVILEEETMSFQNVSICSLKRTDSGLL